MTAGLYIHIPFCQRKCFYCDFYSIENTELINQFVDYLMLEIQQKVLDGKYSDLTFDTIFFGGGTPSLLSGTQISRILDLLHKNFKILDGSEITIECNPQTIDKEKLSAYRKASINRLSIGVQSFLNSELNFLRRIHNANQARESLNLAFESGFENLSIDLLFALPKQRQEDLLFSLEEAYNYPISHISYYNLTYEEDTPLYQDLEKGKIEPLSDDEESSLYLSIIKNLEQQGFKQYEVSNFSKPNLQCKHNLKYWTDAPYIGFGPSAHSYFDNCRWKNVDDLLIYFNLLSKKEEPLIFSEELSFKDRMMENIFLSLRADGLVLEQFAKEFFFDILFELREVLLSLTLGGFLSIDKTKIKLTAKGYSLCDEICLRIIRDIENKDIEKIMRI